MVDYEQELKDRLRRGTSATPVEVTPGPADDPEAALIARLRSQAIADKLAVPATRANPRGQVLPTPDWNMGMSVGHGMLQGYLPEIMGLAGTGGLMEGGGVPEGFSSRYEQNINRLKAAHKAYGEENPGKALVGELGGSMATLIPAMAAGAGAIAPLGAGIARAAPWAAGLVDFLSGTGRGAMKLPSLAARGAVEGAGAAVGSSGLSDKPLGEQIKTGAGIGALINPVVGGITSKLGSKVNATTAETAQALLDQGVPLRAGQIPGSNKVAQGLDKVFGGGNAQQREAFAEQLSGKYAGYPTKEINQEWVNTSKNAEGKVMNDIQSVYAVPALESGLIADLAATRSHALSNFSLDNAKKIDGFIGKIEENLYSPMSGATYKNLTQKGGLLDNMSKDKDIAGIVPKLREALDDAWGRTLPADKKAAWDQARYRYKVLSLIDESMGGTGAAEGVYNPKKLLKAVEDRFGNVENAGELGLLARGGQFLEPPGASPASAKHGTAKMVGNMALGGAAAVAASEGSKVITHMGPEAIAALTQHPESYALPLLLAAGLYGGAKAGNAALNGPRATQYLLDVSRGSRNPMLRGNNPLLPMLVEGYNRQ